MCEIPNMAATAMLTEEIQVPTSGRGTYEITDSVADLLNRSGFSQGVLTLFCRHTSASLVLMENADPDVRRDLENWLNRLVPEGDPHFVHTLEGPDDMPAHIKTAITHSSESIPFSGGRLLLGIWQGIFLWEHRRVPHNRSVVVNILGE